MPKEVKLTNEERMELLKKIPPLKFLQILGGEKLQTHTLKELFDDCGEQAQEIINERIRKEELKAERYYARARAYIKAKKEKVEKKSL